MNDIAEGVGSVAEGALLSAAIETNHTKSGPPSEASACANCGADAPGAFCWNCGQKLHVHRTLRAIGHDLMHGVLHLDGKLFTTLPLLAFKPGQLTRRYIEGERAKFVSPMAMFLFSVFAMFAVFQMLGLSVPADLDSDVSADGAAQYSEEFLAEQEAELKRELAGLDPAADGYETRRLEAEEALGATEAFLKRLRAPDNASSEGSIDLRDMQVNVTGIEAFDKGLVEKWQKNPSLMLYKLQANGYKFSWLLIPLSLPTMIMLFIWRRRVHAYDHTVFVTYSLSFMSLMFIALSVLNAAGLGIGWIISIFAIIAPLHLYKHLRNAHELSRFSTLWRFAGLIVSIMFVAVIFLQSLLLLGAF